MKTTIKKYLAVAIIMFVTFTNYANEKNTTIKVIEGKKVRIEFGAVKKGHTLSIKDKNGTVIYSQEIKNSGTYSKILDLSKLEKGNYTTELEKDFEIVIKPFTVLDGQVSFNTEKTIFKPVIRTEDNIVYISRISFDKAALNVSIYYNDELIFSETAKDEKTLLNRVYKLSKEEIGNYKVVVNSNNKYYSKSFKI
ncbi:DUF3244 domain-containing protein [Polaribacter sp. PL03]|uniref:DUF3244 domain-containing protein n=1 Tax=Polaribacter sp. PL03 TaxID=3088353 RepID=UPI0029D2F236|nr:DUF3244 domain-containing protein [Polaribacter sp. PL03]MDX6745696.1 DUF3244 domain-containing protein [Polaribacter sp. PL03]